MQEKGKLLFVPSGGLANRMRALASAYTLTQAVGSSLEVVWFQDWALHAPFYSIFNPPNLLPLREATVKDMLLYDRARRRNLWIPKLPQRFLFERQILEQEVTPLKQQGFDFESWARGHQCYMSCYQVFGTFPNSLYKRMFRPVKEVIDQVERYHDRFSAHTIGLHIRRTDNDEAIAKSPTELFIRQVEEEIEANDETMVYLATDSDEVKEQLRQRFGERIITPQASASRSNIAGIWGALTDMWTLAATQKIYGSAGSSFSPMAASIGDVPLEIIDSDTSRHGIDSFGK